MSSQFGGDPTHFQIDLETTGAERLKEAVEAMQKQAAAVAEKCAAMITSDLSCTNSASLQYALKMSSVLINLQDSVVDELNRVQVVRELLVRREQLSAQGFDDTQIAGMAVAEAEARLGSNNPRLAIAYLMIALYCKDMGWYHLASQWMSKAVETQRGAVRTKPEIESRQADLERYLVMLAGLFALQYEYKRAAENMEDALYYQKAIYGQSHERTCFTTWALERYRELAAEGDGASGQVDADRLAAAHFSADVGCFSAELQQLYANRD